jgi:hypothetical protein
MKVSWKLGAAFWVVVVLPCVAQDWRTLQIPGTGDCGMEGSATRAEHKALNQKKNRFVAPGTGAFETRVNMLAMLAPGDDTNRWNDQRAGTLTGFVVSVQVGGVETCNCKTTRAAYRDTHIALAVSENATAPTKLVHVEVTPRIRLQKAAQGIDWSTAALGQRLAGKWVTVRGWLLFDFMHMNESENTAPRHAGNWRGTAWEIHPVTDIQVLPGPPVFTPHGFVAARADGVPMTTRPLHRWVKHRNAEQSEFWVVKSTERAVSDNPYRVPDETEED